MKLAFFSFLIVSMVCLVSCPVGVPPSENSGSLVLTVSDSKLAAKTIVPPLDMSVVYYNISGDGPNPETFSQTGVTTTAFVKNGLAAGAWTIVVDAFNSNDYLIGSGSTAATISPGATAQATVQVTPLSGTGSMTIGITWPSGAILNPVLSGILAAAGGAPQAIPFTMGADSASCSYPSLGVGYYSLAIQLADGTALKWGSFDAVRVLKAQTTTVDYDLTLIDINTGSMSLEITPAMQNPIAITFSGQQPELPLGVDMTVAATTSETVDSYQWYLDGSRLPGEIGSSITLGSALPMGRHRLDVGITKANVLSSTSVSFQVVPVPIIELLSQISESEIHATASDLQGFITRAVGYQGNIDAATYIHGRFAAIPELSVEYHGGSIRNVVATLPGTDQHSDAVYIVGAHYDSISDSPELAPGATDNGCGVGIILELARIMSKYHFKDTLKFVSWNSEEQGQVGSLAYVVEADQNHENILLYLNFDSAGYDPYDRRILDIMHNDGSLSIAGIMSQRNSLYELGLTLTYNAHGCESDHRPFWAHGYTAVMTHSEEHGPSHTASDTVDKISTQYAKRNGQLGLAVLAELAGLLSIR